MAMTSPRDHLRPDSLSQTETTENLIQSALRSIFTGDPSKQTPHSLQERSVQLRWAAWRQFENQFCLGNQFIQQLSLSLGCQGPQASIRRILTGWQPRQHVGRQCMLCKPGRAIALSGWLMPLTGTFRFRKCGRSTVGGSGKPRATLTLTGCWEAWSRAC